MHNFPLLCDRPRNCRQTTHFQHTATLSQRIYGVQRRQLRFQDIVDQLENRVILASDTEPNVIDRWLSGRERSQTFERNSSKCGCEIFLHVRENRSGFTCRRHHVELQFVLVQNVRGVFTGLLRGQIPARWGGVELDAAESVGFSHERPAERRRFVRFPEGGQRATFERRVEEAGNWVS